MHDLSPNELVKRGCIQVMEGRHVFEHLTVEKNLLTGTYTRKERRSTILDDLKKNILLLSPLKGKKVQSSRIHFRREQQMMVIGRALMSKPKMILLDEPSMGLAPQLVEEIFEIVKDLNQRERLVSCLLSKNKYRFTLRKLWLRSGKRKSGNGWGSL
ncbi:MAG: hypothetical protein CM1200mP30_15100 [Pseudomonadota bacterium]|nr:MAG: hypothetical protein CM1200mP30_15100 [Pseudomonadota bacterium]